MRTTASLVVFSVLVLGGCASRKHVGYAVGGTLAAVGVAAATYTLTSGCGDHMDGGGNECTALGLTLSLPVAFAGGMIVTAAARERQVDSPR